MSETLSVNSNLSHYRIVSKLGAGGMGEVWLAEDTRLERKVALKLLPAEFTQDPDRVRRFMQEAKAASALNHPNIITVYDIGECEAGRFIVMELVAGRTLRSVIARDNSLETLLAIGSQIAKALSAAHSAGITHRDIKPDNIMVRDDGYVKVLDFGLARLLPTTSGEDAATLAQQTTPGMIMGTVAYMSPEQARGQSASPPSDVFSLGIVLYELVTGQHPFRAETLVGYLHTITSQTPLPPSRLKPEIPASLDDLILRMLEKDLLRRPSAGEIARALQEIERRGDTRKLLEVESETVLLPAGYVHGQISREGRKEPQRTEKPTDDPGSTPADEGFWVAVLPFKYRGSNVDLEALAEGLSEEIITGLSRFSYLRVIARSSTLRFASEASDIRTIGKELGARYVMEGSLRQAGSTLRVTVQLVDTATGAHLWAETYDRQFSAEQIFVLQDDLVPRIVSTVADAYGILPHSMSLAVRSKGASELTPYESLLRSFSYVERVTAEEHAEAKAALERAVQQTPGDSDCWAMLSILHTDEHIHGFSARTGLLEQALQLARRAVDANPLNHRAYQALAWALCYRKEFDSCRHAAERTVALNPMDAGAMAYVGQTIAYGGGWERGCELLNRAMQLNPHHPGWYRYALFLNAYRQADYRGALDIALKMNMPGVSLMYVALAAASGQLGELEAAREAVRELLALRPDFKQAARAELEKLWDSELVDSLIDGLRKAGLEIVDEERPAGASVALHSSGETRADEGFWVAVLPFKSTGTAVEIAALAEALSEEIVTGLSRFSYLRVIARGSTLRYANQTADLRAVGKELGARYVMEGSLRQAGAKLRLAVQLVDTTTGAHLWAENYERSFSPEEVFELQDDLVPCIVSTVADQYGALVHSMSESLRGRGAGQYSPHEAVLRAFGYGERQDPEEHREVREILEAAVASAPGHSGCQAGLSVIYWNEYANGYNVRPDPLGRAHAAARQAVAVGPTNQLAHSTLATVLFFKKDFLAFRPIAERALALNRMDTSTTALLGTLIAYAGDWEYGLGVVEQAKQLNPHYAGWYHFPAFHYAYHRRDYSGALEIALKINLPGYFFTQAVLAAVYGQLGEQKRASEALRELQAMVPSFGTMARAEFGKWVDTEHTEHLIDGLRKAGLRIADEEGVAAPSTGVADTRSTPDDGGRPAIAVLPFANLSADSDQEYFCDGLAEELLNALSKIEALRVAARTSAFSFKGKETDIREVGRKLNVSAVLQGSVRKAGNRLRITAQLVNVSDGFHIWSERYDREMKDIFELQDEITLSVIDALKLKLFGGEKEAVLKRYTDDAEVHELFLKGRYHAYKYTAEGWKRAIEFFEKAIEKQPDYAPAYAEMASCWGCLWFFGIIAAEPAVTNCKTATRRALAIDENLAEAHLPLALMEFFYDWEWEQAEQSFKQAIALNPNNAEALSYYALFIAFVGRFDEAITTGKRSLEIDPLAPLINMNVGWTYFSSGLSDEAFDQAGKMIEIEPDFFGAYWLKGAIYLSEGEYEKAVEELKKAVSLGGHQIVLSDLGSAYGLAGQENEAAAILEQLLEMRRQEYVPAICLARIYSRIGEKDKAIEWLEKAFEERNGEMVFLQGEIEGAAAGDSLNNLGNDPRLMDLLQRMNLPC